MTLFCVDVLAVDVWVTEIVDVWVVAVDAVVFVGWKNRGFFLLGIFLWCGIMREINNIFGKV